jgi:hypothetical protein
MTKEIKNEANWKAQAIRLLNALQVAEGALEEWGDETTLPFVTRIIDEVEKEICND